MVEFDIDKLVELLESLKGVPNIREIQALRKRLVKEKQKIIKSTTVVPTPAVVTTSANVKRSTKLQRYWRYVKLIRDNFPNLTTNQIRKQLKERQQGSEVNIPDVVWQNPSP